MAYVVSDQRTGQALTSCLDRRRADLLTFGFEQYAIRDDIGARNHYWHLGRLPLGAEHPYETGARRLLEAERDTLMARHLRNTENLRRD
jgi:hypothetical protein